MPAGRKEKAVRGDEISAGMAWREEREGGHRLGGFPIGDADAEGRTLLGALPVSRGEDRVFFRQSAAPDVLLLWLPCGRQRDQFRDGDGACRV